MINLMKSSPDHSPVITEDELSDEEVLTELKLLKEKLQHQVVILGHHYQQDDIISFADMTGDSLGLAQKVSQINKPYIVFCGVHFMAETADMLTSTDQQVILPDLNAGCSMADMANRADIERCWHYLTEVTKQKIVPITYVNCSADLKAFVGKHGGSICTSSNAKKVITWGLSQGEKLLFFPDQHLGRNSCYELGISLDDMVVYDPKKLFGGLTPKEVENAKVILWYGYCSVHKGFTKEQVELVKKNNPETKVIVHPECTFDVVQASDFNGSTSYIINTIKNAPAGTSWAIGTEINLINRLAKTHPDKHIISLSPFQCLCTTMYRVRPRWLLHSMRCIENGKPINVIHVVDEIKKDALKAVNTMLEISKE